MTDVLANQKPNRHTTRMVRRLVLLGFVIGLVTLLSFVWYLYQMGHAKEQLQQYQDHYSQVFTSFNLTLAEAQRELRDLIHLPMMDMPTQSSVWEKQLIEVSLKLTEDGRNSGSGNQQQLQKTVAKLMDLRECLISTHMQIQKLAIASDHQFEAIHKLIYQMRENINLHHGQHRLEHALMIRNFLDQPQKQSLQQACDLIDHMRDVVVLDGLNSEFGELNLYLEQLSSTRDEAMIADLKDNRIASTIHQLQHERSCQAHQKQLALDTSLQMELEKLLYGKVVPEHTELQTIEDVQGSMFDLCSRKARLHKQQQDESRRIQECISQLLSIQTDLALMTRLSTDKVWSHFQTAGHTTFLQTAVVLTICWSIFFVMGLLIHKRVAQQIRNQHMTEELLHNQIQQKTHAQEESQKLYQKLVQAHKLESIGQLAAGIASEINSPSQYVTDNTRFLKTAFDSLYHINELQEQLLHHARGSTEMTPYVTAIDKKIQELDANEIWHEIPLAINQSIDGIKRVSDIVQSMQQFALSTGSEKISFNLNNAVQNALTVSRNTWKYVAQIRLELDRGIPMFQAQPSEINQMLLNLIVNASIAISDRQQIEHLHEGIITIKTQVDHRCVQLSISDNGVGIAPEIRERIFDPFFTTRPVGQGLGQGLSQVYACVVEKHHGEIMVDSVVGQGATFIMHFPLLDEKSSGDGAVTSAAATKQNDGTSQQSQD